jgi:hypothetical protein
MVFIREMKAKKKNSIFPYRKHIPIVQNHHAKNSHNAQQKSVHQLTMDTTLYYRLINVFLFVKSTS